MKVFAKLRRGVVEIAVGDDCRYAEPSFLQRAYLLWTFRNFRRLSVRALNQRQRQIVERLSDTEHTAEAKRIDPALVIGRAEFPALPLRKPLGPVVVPAIQPTVETQHAASGRRRPRSVNPLAGLPRTIVRHAAESLVTPSVRRTRSHARYSLILILASASLVAISGAVAQRLWTNHGKSSPSVAKAGAASLKPARLDNALVLTAAGEVSSSPLHNAKPSPIPSAKPVAQQTPIQLSSTIAPANILPVTNSPKPEKPSRAGAASLETSPETAHLQVFLAPRSVIYPTVPSSGTSDDRRQDIFVKAVVNTHGTVDDVQVRGQTPALANAIAKTVRQWRYQPYVVNGQPVAVETHMVFTVLGPDAITVRFLPPGESAANP